MEPETKIERFEDLILWQKSMDLAEEIYRATNAGLFSRDWGLSDQIRKAVISISSNIAEGYGRYRADDFKRFLTMANGSAYEVRSQVQLAGRLGYLGPLDVETLVKRCEEISRMLIGLRKKMKKF
jgi:four helix bundle protein